MKHKNQKQSFAKILETGKTENLQRSIIGTTDCAQLAKNTLN
jgi:hypothetical protein